MLPGFTLATGQIRRICAASMIMLALSVSVPGRSEPSVAGSETPTSIRITVEGAVYPEVREALLEAIAADGLAAPMISDFGGMLQRTAADLGHSDALYGQAEIFTFCSIVVAARLAAEARENIAQCPMSIALYTTPESANRVFMAYRLPPTQSPGAQMATETLARITARARAQVFP